MFDDSDDKADKERAEALSYMAGIAEDLTTVYRGRDNFAFLSSEDRQALADLVGGDLDEMRTEDGANDAIERYFYDSLIISLDIDNEAHEMRAVFCSGGPHHELRFTVKDDKAEDIWWLSLPWFGRCEVRDEMPTSLIRYANQVAEMIDGMGGVETHESYDADEWYGVANDDESDEEDSDDEEESEANDDDGPLGGLFGYTIGFEWCGQPTQMHIVRRFGEWVDKFTTYAAAVSAIEELGGFLLPSEVAAHVGAKAELAQLQEMQEAGELNDPELIERHEYLAAKLADDE